LDSCGAAGGEFMGQAYWSQVQESSKRSKIRSWGLNKIIPTGVGTIYSWDFAYVKPETGADPERAGQDTKNALFFRYIGLSAAATTQKRLGQHSSGAGTHDDRRMYNILKEAKDWSKKSENNGDIYFPSNFASDTSIVRVVHFVSLFDLGNVEAYMINNGNEGFNGDSLIEAGNLHFNEIANQNGNKKYGLNTSATGGQGDPMILKKSNEDYIVAAYIYLTENNDTILAAREYGIPSKLPNATGILKETNFNFREATILLINRIKKDNPEKLKFLDTDNKSLKTTLDNFYGKLSSKDTKLRGFANDGGVLQKNDDGSTSRIIEDVDFASKFPNSITLFLSFQLILKDGKTFTAQGQKRFFIRNMLNAKLSTEEEVQKLLEESNQKYTEELGRSALITKVQNRKNDKFNKKLTNIYIEKMDKVITRINNYVSTGKGDNLEMINLVAVEDISELISEFTNQTPKEIAKEIMTDKQKAYQSGKKRAGKNFISDKDAEIIYLFITEYVSAYIRLNGDLPDNQEISAIFNVFRMSNSPVQVVVKGKLS
jgi:metal-responsive CopG/Arc/MetJ family transcriptional regulator